MKKDLKHYFSFKVSDIAEISILVAVAILLDKLLTIRLGSSGGSLNFSTVPLFIIALRHGPFKGFIASGVIFGLISCLIDGYGLACFPLEYLLAFGLIGYLGFYANSIYNSFGESKKQTALCYILIAICVLVWAVLRLFLASIDSMLLWGYDFDAALTYNLTYTLPTAIAVLVLLVAGLATINHLNHIRPSSFLKAENSKIQLKKE